MADRGARGRGAAEPGGQPGPGPADGLGPDRGRRPARRVPGRGLDDRAPRRPPPPPHRRRGRRCRRAVRAGTAVPGARCRGRGPGRRGRGAARGARAGPPPSTRASTGSRSPATRCAPGSASPTRPPPSCCASSAPARASRREPPAPPDPGCLPAPAGAPGPRRAGRLPARWCPRGSTARRAAWRGRRLDRHREGVATYRDGLAGHGPAGSRPAPARPVRGGTARCRRGGPPARCPGQGPGTVSRISRPFIRVREPVALPHRQLIRVPIRVPADSGAPFQRRTCRTRRE